MADRGLAFEDDDPAMRGEARAGGEAGDAAADDQEIRALHGAPR